jgi:hypothetical protein
MRTLKDNSRPNQISRSQDLVPSKRTRDRYKQEVPMALEKTGLMRRRGEHAFAA